jgi:hypothetical protein
VTKKIRGQIALLSTPPPFPLKVVETKFETSISFSIIERSYSYTFGDNMTPHNPCGKVFKI